MKNNFINSGLVLILIIDLAALTHTHTHTLEASAATHHSCKPSGKMTGIAGKCNTENDSECCVAGKNYTTYECSPRVSRKGTKAILTINSFEKGGDGGAESECDKEFHNDDELVVALSTGWFNQKGRCNQTITIRANGRNVTAKVVDECDSTEGCDEIHDYQPPCPNNIVDGSKAVWDALGVNTTEDELEVTWTDGDAHF